MTSTSQKTPKKTKLTKKKTTKKKKKISKKQPKDDIGSITQEVDNGTQQDIENLQQNENDNKNDDKNDKNENTQDKEDNENTQDKEVEEENGEEGEGEEETKTTKEETKTTNEETKEETKEKKTEQPVHAIFKQFKKKKGKKGNNVSVVCRFRPQNKREKKLKSSVVIDIDEEEKSVAVEQTRIGNYRFNFDRIFGMESTQQQVFEQIGLPVVEDLFHGYNGTVFVYGQTGAGKTFSMMGPNEKGSGYCDDGILKGLVPRVVEYIFQTVTEAPITLEFTIQVSYVEIYMEKIRDLFNPVQDNLSIKEDKELGIYVDGTTKEYVGSVEEVFKLMKHGASNRVVAGHLQNAESSRSHSIFIITLNQKDTESLEKKSGTLFLVDLAGSEKVKKTGAEGQLLEEAKQINRSLSALGNVINALTDSKTKFVPYRDSKLTRLLQDSLGGNCRTTLMICCSPSAFNVEETLSTLRFGERAKSIKNKAKVNKQYTAKELKKLLDKAKKEITKQKAYAKGLQAQVNALRSKLGEDVNMDDLMAAATTPGGGGGMKELLDKIEALEEELEGEKKRSEQLLSERDSYEDSLNSLKIKHESIMEEYNGLQEELDFATKLYDDNENLNNELAEKTVELQQVTYNLKQKEVDVQTLTQQLADVEKQLQEKLDEEPQRPEISEEMLLAAAEAIIAKEEPSTPKTHHDHLESSVQKVSPLDPKQIEKMKELARTPEFIKKFKDDDESKQTTQEPSSLTKSTSSVDATEETSQVDDKTLTRDESETTSKSSDEAEIKIETTDATPTEDDNTNETTTTIEDETNEDETKEDETKENKKELSLEEYNSMIKRLDNLKEQNKVFYNKITQLTQQSEEHEKARDSWLKDKEKAEKLRITLIRDLQDRCKKVIDLEMDLDRVKDQKHLIEQICKSKDPHHKILQYRKSLSILEKKNHQLTTSTNDLTLKLQRAENKHGIFQSHIKGLVRDLKESMERNKNLSEKHTADRTKMSERMDALVRKVKSLKAQNAQLKQAYQNHPPNEARVVRAIRGGGRQRSDSNVERKIIIRGGSNQSPTTPPKRSTGGWGTLSPKS